MQCFTRKEKRPRTVQGCEFKAPPSVFYHTRPRWSATPDWAGRPSAPDAVPLRPYVNRPEMLYNPLCGLYREKRMPEMLRHINVVNWSTGRDAHIAPPRTRPFSETLRHDTSTVTRSTYVNHGHQPIEPPYTVDNEVSSGVLPKLYSVPKYRPVGEGLYVRVCDPVCHTVKPKTPEAENRKGRGSTVVLPPAPSPSACRRP
ncbi:uncharacterized protein LOC101856019 [Aplysia californica]|uniref:Uncharacterized protein LOC101856019 n=1 Tax=Aplysia californica TaxID=6500 RepID=A0ABM0JMJ4_APLCA|nr:uncharacterized protein LOC101856019 [Aplysia californica]